MKIQMTLGIAVAATTLIGAVIAFDTHYAKSSQMEEISTYVCRVEKRLDTKIQQDRINSLQERMWRLEDRYTPEKARDTDEYRRLKLERENILRNVKEK